MFTKGCTDTQHKTKKKKEVQPQQQIMPVKLNKDSCSNYSLCNIYRLVMIRHAAFESILSKKQFQCLLQIKYLNLVKPSSCYINNDGSACIDFQATCANYSTEITCDQSRDGLCHRNSAGQWFL
ncbi:unnamed protein product [Paramecium sonneborni]|uniref:Uncharacterized protein n=1 Tax=Paramecium sonneborni TaxID=65129 RepID=A0A8S1RSJ8_9CILI|nr:unnamed protein product [Paramecium sonneborni]